MKWYEKFVLKAEDGIGFEVLDGTNGELIIRARNIEKTNVYSKNYIYPPILEGYKYVCGEWNNGFVIERRSDEASLYGFLLEVSPPLTEHLMENIFRRNSADDLTIAMNFRIMDTMKL